MDIKKLTEVAFGAAMANLRIGPGNAPGVELGPLVNPAAVAKVGALVDDAIAGGAHVVAQGERPEQGWFYPATVLGDVAPDAALLHTEIFGPVAPVVSWSAEQDVLRWCNASEFGLVSYVYSANLVTAMRIAEGLDTGMVGINRGLVSDPSAPFGGVKQSGLGREGAHEGIDAFLETKYLALDWPS